MTGLTAVLESWSEQHRAEMTDAAASEVVFASSLDEVRDRLDQIEVLAGHWGSTALAELTRLRWVHSWAAGVDSYLTPELRASDVVLTSSAGNGAIPLAEHSMLLMLMLNRDVPRWSRAQTERRWDRFRHGELNGLTLGIVGMGNSGTDLAEKAHAFHMRVLGLRRRADMPVRHVERIYAPDELHAFLAECDVVVVTAALTESTRGMFDEAAFRAMKPSATWICISRGGIADDDALLEALQNGWIAGTGIDAHGTEPLPSDSPFWTLPNVIVTPHNAATTPGTLQRGVDIFVDNLRRYAVGEPLRNVVDRQHGY